MKRKSLPVFFLLLALITAQSYPQIVITQQDVENIFAPGKSWTTYANQEVNGSVSMNIGMVNNSIPQNWQIPVVSYPDTSISVTVTPASTGYHSYFTDATHCTKSSGLYMGYNFDSFQFRKINSSGVWDIGTLSHVYGSGVDTIIVEHSNDLGLILPLALGTTYQDYYDSSAGGAPGFYNVEEVIKNCDAYGSISFLGNNNIEALRITTSTAHRVYQNGSLINSWFQREYDWFTKERGFISVDADTSSILAENVPVQEIEVTVISGSTGIADDINKVNSFMLTQNYPNPFNPSTVISYQLAAGSQVSLKVYDVLGNEVAVLINEEQAAGNYSINFNASNLTSGIYYYRLVAGSFSETKSMILIK